jgi:hypothetical protein
MEKYIIIILIIIILINILFVLIYYANLSLNPTICNKNETIRSFEKIHNNKNTIMCYNYNISNLKNKNLIKHKNNYLIGNKKYLWITLTKFYGSKIAQTITPMTYIIPNDYNKYVKECSNKKMIFKENVHQQQGLFITKRIQNLSFLTKQKFIVGQEFIEDTLKYNGYKLSFRLYLIIKCINGKLQYYIYKDGLVYYGLGDIATFYNSTNTNQIYKNNPILISDLEKEINLDIRKLMVNKIDLLIPALKLNFCSKDTNNKFFEIYGIDFHITNKLDAYILEVNSGPGMEPNNIKDNKLRIDLMKFYSSIINSS